MPGLNLGPSYGAGGFAEGLQRILENQWMERRLAMQERAQQQEEAYRQAALEQQAQLRRDVLEAQRQNQQETRDLRAFSLLGEGDQVGASDLSRFKALGLGSRFAPMEGPLAPGQERPALFKGTSAQEYEARRRRETESALTQIPEGPEKSALQYRLLTGDNPPAEMLRNREAERQAALEDKTFLMQLAASLRNTGDEKDKWQYKEMDVNGTTQPGRVNLTTGMWEPVQVPTGTKPAGRQLSPAAKMKVAEMEANLVGLDQLESQMRDAWVGPVAGRALLAAQSLPEGVTQTLGVDVNQSRAEFYARNHRLRDRIIKDITGAQMSEAEVARIRQSIPLPTDRPEVWRAKLAALRKERDILINKYRNQLGMNEGLQPEAVTNQAPSGGAILSIRPVR